jgi:NAD(P)-dependent dehydrogenase (short-subunit alcohol dehydrogenase family)
MQTNHLSHFLLTLGLLPALRKAAEQQRQQQGGFTPRIVTVASAMHHLGYRLQQDPLSQQSYSAELAYGNSKLAQVGPGNACAEPVAAAAS